MKQLLVMRHGKSDWSAGGTADHDRPLNRRGVASAKTMGGVLTAAGLQPDLVVTSSARRARTTAQLAAEAGGWSAPISADDRLYFCDVADVLAVVGDTPDGVQRLMVVGHQPTWGALVAHLTGASAAMRTCAAAVIDLMLGASWANDGDVTGELVALLQPRHFADG